MMEGPLNSVLLYGTHYQTHVAINYQNVYIHCLNKCRLEKPKELFICVHVNRVEVGKSYMGRNRCWLLS